MVNVAEQIRTWDHRAIFTAYEYVLNCSEWMHEALAGYGNIKVTPHTPRLVDVIILNKVQRPR